MNKSERKQFEKQRYNILKNLKDGLITVDKSVIYYVISAKWVHSWRDYIKSNGPLPGEIDNNEINSYIEFVR